MRTRAGSQGFWVVAALCVALPAQSAPRVVVENFAHDKRGSVRAQVATALCAQVECVPPSRVLSKKRIDWKKVVRERVEAVLSGSVTKTKLSLSLVDAHKKRVWHKALPAPRGRVNANALNAAAQEALNALPSGGAAALPVAKNDGPSPPPPEDRPFFAENADGGTTGSAPSGAGTATEPSATPDAGTAEVAAVPDAGADATGTTNPPTNGEPVAEGEKKPDNPPAALPPRTQPIIVAELGTDILTRRLDYQALQTPNLSSYHGLVIVMPSLRAEVYPLAPFLRGWATGVAVIGDVSFSVGLNSSLKSGDGTTYPTHTTRYGVGLKWAIRPIAGSAFSFGPEVSYRSWDFHVDSGANGTVVPGVPPLAYRALDLGLSLEIPLGGIGMLAGRASYLPVFSAADLLSPSIFASGRAYGLNAEVSLGFFLGLKDILELRLTAFFNQTNLSFTNVGPTDTYRASGATDRYLGGRLGLRVRW